MHPARVHTRVEARNLRISPLNSHEKNNLATATPVTNQLFHLLHRAGQGGDELFLNMFRDADLTPRQFTVLTAAQQRADSSQAGLVADTGIDRSTLADIVGRLVAKGLLERHRTKRDARAYAIAVTDKGHETIATLSPRIASMEGALLSALPDDQRETFAKNLEAIVHNLNALQ